MVATRASSTDPAELRVVMREPWDCGCSLGLLLLALFGLGGAWVILSSLEYASEDGAWFGLVVSLPLALLIGAYALLALTVRALHHVVPSRIEGDAEARHLRIWHTWNGMLANFRRVRVRVPRRSILGLAVGQTQSGQFQLFVRHVSGQHFYAGFTGRRPELDETATVVGKWLAPRSSA